eukprot:2230905-Pyramimonas_sp.AAC.1
MASVLRRHYWAEIFRKRGIRKDRLEERLVDDSADRERHGTLHAAVQELRLARKRAQEALRLSSDSCPGPDGQPYGAWRALDDVAVNVLHGDFEEMTSAAGEEQ